MAPIKVLDTILGANFLAVQQALNVLERPELKLGFYRILVLSQHDQILVLFTDPNGQAGTRENFAVRQGAEMELNAHDLTLLVSRLDQYQTLDSIQGASLLAIQAAVGEFLRRNLDLNDYRLQVVLDGDSIVVVFTDKTFKPGVRGQRGKPGFETALDPHNLTVRRANFVR